jgi:hypothetical protein
MALGTSSADTRVVRVRRRADSKAATEPRGHRVVLRREVEETPEPAVETARFQREPVSEWVAETVPYGPDFRPEIASAPPRESLPYLELEVSTDAATAPREAARPRIAGRVTWLGIVLSPPQVGAALVIGTWLRPEFRVTSPITRVFPREGGMLVLTATNSRYFVMHAGDTYLIRR